MTKEKPQAPIARMVASTPSTVCQQTAPPSTSGPVWNNEHIVTSNRQAIQTRSVATPAPARLFSTVAPSTPTLCESASSDAGPATPTPHPRSPRHSTGVARCDEMPAFFPGHTDVVVAFQDQLEGRTPPPVHCQPVRVCENKINHPNGPHHVCTSCHILAWRHLKAVSPLLVKYNFLPLCDGCAQRLAENFSRAGRQRLVFGCSCLPNHEETKFLCFDCLETALMVRISASNFSTF